MYSFVKAVDIFFDQGSACGDHAVDMHMLADLFYDTGGLQGEFSGGDKYQCLDMVKRGINLF
jgi:hypothetical protein